MPNYKQSTTTGEIVTYLAARSGRFENPYGGVPSLSFDEVERTVLDGRLIAERPTGRVLRVEVKTPPREIPFIDESYQPIRQESGELVEGYWFQDQHFAYLLACVYIDAAHEADHQALQRRGPPREFIDRLPEDHPLRARYEQRGR